MDGLQYLGVGFCTCTCAVSKGRETSEIWGCPCRNMRLDVPFFCPCTQLLWLILPVAVASTANAMAQVPAAGTWLLPVHAALPGRALLASLSSVHMARALCLQDRAFLPLNHLCPRSGRNTTLPVLLAVLGAGSRQPLFIWAGWAAPVEMVFFACPVGVLLLHLILGTMVCPWIKAEQ